MLKCLSSYFENVSSFFAGGGAQNDSIPLMDELVAMILGGVDYASLANCRLCCKRLKKLAESDSVLKQVFLSNFSYLSVKLPEENLFPWIQKNRVVARETLRKNFEKKSPVCSELKLKGSLDLKEYRCHRLKTENILCLSKISSGQKVKLLDIESGKFLHEKKMLHSKGINTQFTFSKKYFAFSDRWMKEYKIKIFDGRNEGAIVTFKETHKPDQLKVVGDLFFYSTHKKIGLFDEPKRLRGKTGSFIVYSILEKKEIARFEKSQGLLVEPDTVAIFSDKGSLSLFDLVREYEFKVVDLPLGENEELDHYHYSEGQLFLFTTSKRCFVFEVETRRVSRPFQLADFLTKNSVCFVSGFAIPYPAYGSNIVMQELSTGESFEINLGLEEAAYYRILAVEYPYAICQMTHSHKFHLVDLDEKRIISTYATEEEYVWSKGRLIRLDTEENQLKILDFTKKEGS